MSEHYPENRRQFIPQELPYYPPLDSEQTPGAIPALVEPDATSKELKTDKNVTVTFTSNGKNIIASQSE